MVGGVTAALRSVRIRGQTSNRSINSRQIAWNRSSVHTQNNVCAILVAVAFSESGSVD